MKFSVKSSIKCLATIALAASLAAAPFASGTAHAQMGGGGGMGGGMGGGGGRGGGLGGMRNSPKGRLSRLVRGIIELEQDKKAPLSKDQAKRIAGAIKPWRSRKTMSDDQAKGLYMSVNNVLTSKQRNELDKESAKNRRFGGERPGGGRGGMGGGMGGPGGPGGPGGGGAPDMAKMREQMQKMRGFMKTMNPFYPPSGYAEMKSAPERMREGMNRRYQRQSEAFGAIARKGGVKW